MMLKPPEIGGNPSPLRPGNLCSKLTLDIQIPCEDRCLNPPKHLLFEGLERGSFHTDPQVRCDWTILDFYLDVPAS